MMGILVVARGHALPVPEPTEAASHGVARSIPFQGVKLGVWFVHRFRAGMMALMPCCASPVRKASIL